MASNYRLIPSCPQCAFDMRGHTLPAVCPECGLACSSEDVFPRRRGLSILGLALFLPMALTAGALVFLVKMRESTTFPAARPIAGLVYLAQWAWVVFGPRMVAAWMIRPLPRTWGLLVILRQCGFLMEAAFAVLIVWCVLSVYLIIV